MRKMQRFNILLGIAALGCALVAASASATPPTRIHYSFAGITATDTSLCGFPIELLILVGDDVFTQYFDKDGNTIMAHNHFVQQDQFSANGKTLTGIPYTANIQSFIEAGVWTMLADGVLEKVPLPDGSLFIAAGRVTVAGFVYEPDHGAFQNLAGFCAALAP